MSTKKCQHEEGFERIGEYQGRIYQETRERCKICGFTRQVGEEDWKKVEEGSQEEERMEE
jgi:hypothetical protein